MTRLMDRPSTQAIAQARERFARRHRRRRALLGLFTTVVKVLLNKQQKRKENIENERTFWKEK